MALSKPIKIFHTQELADLARIHQPSVKAVIYVPRDVPDWHWEVHAAVVGGHFRFARTFTDFLSMEEVSHHLHEFVPNSGITDVTRTRLIDDIVELAAISLRLTGTDRFQMRYLTDPPGIRHSFHLDLTYYKPAVRVLRVYGAGTEYVDPENVRSMLDFFRYATIRESLVSRLVDRSKDGPPNPHDLRYKQIVELDRTLPFLRDPNAILLTPPSAIVVIDTVQQQFLWPNEIIKGKAGGWIHRSPLSGAARLVVTVTNARPQGNTVPQV